MNPPGPHASHTRPASVMTIAGSDSGGGAGIQADLKTFAAHHVHGVSAITAVTAQNTREVTAIHALPVDNLRAQIDACMADFDIRAIKIGMLADAQIIHAVADALLRYRPDWVVLDPVMVATSGAKLLHDDALNALRMRLLPLADIVTPNLPEAQWLLDGPPIHDEVTMHLALGELRQIGVRAALLKGGHLANGDDVLDLFDDGNGVHAFRHARLPVNAHGTGCTLSAAIAAELANGHDVPAACRRASDYVHRALLGHYQPGRGDVAILDHIGAAA